jgi:BirA family biotin operon repressor/biotin-[acetyl-CoA-carboxylase] ligase
MEQIGRNIIRLESVDSTNNYTANLIKGRELDHGSVILAVEQTDGRGQMGTQWLTRPGENLTISIFLDDVNLSVNEQFFLTQITSLSILDFLRKIGIQGTIKWPNDIYVDGYKIAGILIENILSGSNVKKSILGIGLNVNQDQFPIPKATSLKMITGMHRNMDDVLFTLIACFNARIESGLKSELLNTDYLKNLYLINELAQYEDASGIFEGRITGVSPIGQLRIEKNQEEKLYSLKEISFLS